MASVQRVRRVARRKAIKYGLDPNVFDRQIGAESTYNQGAVSPAGAIGAGQLMPATAKSLGVNPNKLGGNLEGAAKYDRQLLNQFGGDYHKAIAAYNAGPGRVSAGGGLPAETRAYVDKILGGGVGREAAAAPQVPVSPSQSRTTVKPGVDRSMDRAQTFISYLLNQSSHDTQGTALLQTIQKIGSLTDSPPSIRTVTGSPAVPSGGGGSVAQLTQRANAISSRHLPYLWGGGHAGKVDIRHVTPLDCSGAVSAVLGINPRVSGDFGGWGRPGDGGNRGVTIYSNSHHVLMKIDGHFFGTSHANPGGGAGWIPQGAIPAGYLKGFTARHA